MILLEKNSASFSRYVAFFVFVNPQTSEYVTSSKTLMLHEIEKFLNS